MHKNDLINPAELRALIESTQYAILSMCADGQPYAVPLNVAYDGEYFYLHSGHRGRKIDLLQKNPKVYLSLVPEARFSPPKASSACGASMKFKSIAVEGVAEVLGENSDPEERRAGLLCLLRRYAIDGLEIRDKVLAQTTLIRVKATSISHRFYSHSED